MTTHTNVKQLGCLVLLTAVLIGAGGCVKQQLYGHYTVMFLEVDDVEYQILWAVRVDGQGRYSFTTLIVSLRAEAGFVGMGSAYTPLNVQIVHLQVDGVNTVVAKTNTLYFTRSNFPAKQSLRIVLEKDYQEVGIDASRLSFNERETLAYLRPILEPLIREHLQPQEPEMEGETKQE